jgi:hypothetical protein
MALGLVNTAHLSVLPKRAVGSLNPPSPQLHYAPFHDQLQYLTYNTNIRTTFFPRLEQRFYKNFGLWCSAWLEPNNKGAHGGGFLGGAVP